LSRKFAERPADARSRSASKQGGTRKVVNIFKAMTAITGLVICSAEAHADRTCDNSSLQGQYVFRAAGATVGVLDTSGALHPFTSPQLINAVGEFTFDGNGSFTRLDFPMGNGTPQTAGAPLNDEGFRTGQTGTYSVDEECTGSMVANIPGGTILEFEFVVGDFGQHVFAVVSHEHVPGLPPAVVPTGTSCTSGCDLGVNVSVELTQNLARRR
jgi:hypothetical protein